VRDYAQMNALQDKYGERGFSVLGFPCNQFGHQENSNNNEIRKVLKHVRPGDGFEPKFELSEKVKVNGKDEDPLFTWLKAALPAPHDDGELSGARAGSNASEFLHDASSNHNILWQPVRRSDVAWNFEKFLIDGNGTPFRRYSRFYETEKISEDIEGLLSGSAQKKRKV